MINLLSENNGNWDKIFSFIIFDVIWNTKLPMTNTTIAYFIIFLWLLNYQFMQYMVLIHNIMS
ncbi:hypothetical protein SMH99_10390 [Spiroplasma poulsonii]|nr:hypothetical protein SMSE_11340 [Spiroplasma poulsonii]PWF98479.1 hypothetical protein SMH99_10390 [Spiroplasma poulsonii]